MQITGNELRARLQALSLLIALAENEFQDSLKGFPGDDKDPRTTDARIQRLENQVATLQVAQMRYNLQVTVRLNTGETMTLADAVKRIGGAGRASKRWRGAIPQKDRYRFRDLESRKADEIVETWMVDRATIAAEAARTATYAAALQAAIAAGNATTVDIPELSEADWQLPNQQ